MARKKKTAGSGKSAPFPSREQILEFINDSPRPAGKREIARAFQLDAEQKKILKKVLREMQDEGALERGRGRRYGGAGSLPSVTVVEISGLDADGAVLARPLNWNSDDGVPPTIIMAPERGGRSAPGIGDRLLARLTPLGKLYEGRTIRHLESRPADLLGIVEMVSGVMHVRPTDRRQKSDIVVRTGDAGGAAPGDLVRVQLAPGRRLGLPQGRIIERIADAAGPKAISLIALKERDIPIDFPAAALAQADASAAAPLEDREDLRDLALVTIDGADARDFDDAVHARTDDDAANSGGHRLVVAIADVAWYVRPGDALDHAAYERGTSVYLPDRVVPMLPEAISNGWCSLRPEEDRPCLVAHLTIDAEGQLKGHRFSRALMRSRARLTYEQVEDAYAGRPDETTTPLVDNVIRPLYAAFDLLEKAREKRGALELDLPERKVILGDDGEVAAIQPRTRLASHRLIEEFMIAANVAAAETLEKQRSPCLYRVHDQPSMEKLRMLGEFLDSLDIPFPKSGIISAQGFNHILERVENTAEKHLVHDVVLRSQAQAVYAPDNLGHFGLGLQRYSHFTSPIRRYPDLVVHRALIRSLGLGAGGLEDEPRDFEEMGEHLSDLERRAAGAERDAVDRFTARFLADRVGTLFQGRINGVTRFGLFVTLDETGADGLVPIRSLADDYYDHDEAQHTLIGRNGGRRYRLGDQVEVMLAEAAPITGGLIFHLMDGSDEAPPPANRGQGRGKGRGKSRGRPHRGNRR